MLKPSISIPASHNFDTPKIPIRFPVNSHMGLSFVLPLIDIVSTNL